MSDLKQVSVVLRRVTKRTIDLVARYGGEEFIALAHNSTDRIAMDLATQIVKAISQLNLEHELSDVSQYANISVGVTTDLPIYNFGKDSSVKFQEKIIGDADKALYLAKSRGRNQACNFNA